MQRRNYADAVTGLVLVGFGLAIAFYVTANHDLGTLRRMGPGMVPMALGGLLVLLGAILALGGMLRPAEDLPELQIRPFVFVLLAVAAFALTVRTLGLVPAVVLLVGLSTLADKEARFRTFLALAAVLCAIAVLVFRVGLGMNLPPFRWPF
jgi:hypothetical protein